MSKDDIDKLLEIASSKLKNPEEKIIRRPRSFNKGTLGKTTKQEKLDRRLDIIFKFITDYGIVAGLDKIPNKLIWDMFVESNPTYEDKFITRQYFFKRINKIFESKRREKFRCYMLDNSSGIFKTKAYYDQAKKAQKSKAKKRKKK